MNHKFRAIVSLCTIVSMATCSQHIVYAKDANTEIAFQEYQVKAAFVFNFSKFVEWPPKTFSSEDAPITIGILGEDPFGMELEELVPNQIVGARKFVIRRSRDLENLETCHILFISRSEKNIIPKILQSLKGKSILTISDIEQFATNGGIICFIKQSNRIRFQINLEAAKSADLKISSKLLSLAKIVESGFPAEDSAK